VPKGLLHEHPRILLRILALADTSQGRCQSALIRMLRISQVRLSKLTQKLVEAGWLTIRRSENDGPRRFTTTTDKGREILDALRQRLGNLVPRSQPPIRSSRSLGRVHPALGQLSFLPKNQPS
jgi:DNA-binding MarR family transcriptional regulator